MKTFNLLFLLSLITSTFTILSADETSSIDQQITAIQQAQPEERVKLMNQFKQQLAAMNADERAKSISQLRAEVQAHNRPTQKHSQEAEMQGVAQHNQMQQSEQLQRMEQMQLRHSGDQYLHEQKQEMEGMGNNRPKIPQQP